MYVSDGNDSGEWKQVDADSLKGGLSGSSEAGLRVITDGSGGLTAEEIVQSFGSLTLSNNATSTAVTAAADATLGNNNDFVEVTLTMAASPLFNMANGSNYLEIVQPGFYKIDVWTSLFCSTPSTTVAAKVVVNDSDYGVRRAKAELPNGSDYANLSGSGIIELEALDQLKLYIAATKTTNVTLEDLNITLTYLAEA